MTAILGTPVGDLIPGILSDGQTITPSQLTGDDTVVGREGNDQIFGLEGADILFGDAGQDILLANQGNDTVYGGQDNDFVYGGQDDDLIFGNIGGDAVFGDRGNDTVYGGKDNDQVFGGRGDDLLLGDLGDDRLSGDFGSDTMSGGGDNDTFVLGRRSNTDAPTATTGGPLISDADCITDFRVVGNDVIELEGGLLFADLQFIDGTGANGIEIGNVMIRDTGSGEYLAVLKGMDAASLSANPGWFLSSGSPSPTPTPTPPTPTPTPTPTPGGTLPESVFEFSSTNFTVDEGSSVTVTVLRTGDITSPASINYGSLDGTALSGGTGADYTAVSGVLQFAAGQSSATFSVSALSDSLTEGAEQLNLILSGGNVGNLPAILTINDIAGGGTAPTPTPTPTPGTTVTPTPATSAPEFFFVQASYDVDRSLGGTTVTIGRNGDLSVAATVTFNTVDGTAFATEPDYSPLVDIPINFAAGQSTATVDILINPNNPVTTGSPETVNLVLSGANVIAPNPAILNLIGGAAVGSTFEFGTNTLDLQAAQTIDVIRTGDTSVAETIQYTFGAGNATFFTDFSAAPGPGTLNFAAGASSVTINLQDLVAGSQGEVATLVLFGGNLGAQAAANVVNI